MAHHSPEMDAEMRDRLSAFLGEAPRLGATRQFPEGKLTEKDEGEIRIAIGHADGKIVIDFGTPTAWIGFTPEQALQIAATLKIHALEVQAGR